MAMPIGATPVLEGNSAKRFMSKMHSDLQRPVGPVGTPKFKNIEKILAQKNVKK